MPEMINYTVTQTRTVKVTANSAEDACAIATAAFTNGQNAGNGVRNGPMNVWGDTMSRIVEKSLLVERDR